MLKCQMLWRNRTARVIYSTMCKGVLISEYDMTMERNYHCTKHQRVKLPLSW